MNPLANLALSVGETLAHEAGRLLLAVALGKAKELLGTPSGGGEYAHQHHREDKAWLPPQ